MKVVIAPDSFKGSISNSECAAAIADGWSQVRSNDELILLPMADGGEGTLETIALRHPDALRVETGIGNGSVWLLLTDGTAYVELASICGLTLLPELEPMGANTYLLGVILREMAGDSRVHRIVLSVGGSASTDGGAGLMVGLGAKLVNREGRPIEFGGQGLGDLHEIDLSEVVGPPSGGVVCLTDVRNPLLGEEGAAPIYAPQKGADPAQVNTLASGLARLQQVAKLSDFAGAGAAGGTPYGLSIAWGTEIRSGAEAIADLIGLPAAISQSDLVITGEGRLDSQSEFGKVVGVVSRIAQACGKELRYCVGSSEKELGDSGIALIDIAPSRKDAMSHSQYWLVEAGKALAQRFKG